MVQRILKAEQFQRGVAQLPIQHDARVSDRKIFHEFGRNNAVRREVRLPRVVGALIGFGEPKQQKGNLGSWNDGR